VRSAPIDDIRLPGVSPSVIALVVPWLNGGRDCKRGAGDRQKRPFGFSGGQRP
jgi:hypothetical protein